MNNKTAGIYHKAAIVYHGSGYNVRVPDTADRTGVYKDFGPGFYCTSSKKQAQSWAERKQYTAVNGERIAAEYPIVNRYIADAFTELELNYCGFGSPDELWAEFIARCRTGVQHTYDIVEGPIADDTIYRYAEAFIRNRISMEKFLYYCRCNHPTHQIAFCTDKGLSCLHYDAYSWYDRKLKKWSEFI